MTIEERAKAYLHNEITQPQRLAMYEAYKDGAYDQRQIDIDKACEWFKGFLQEIGYEDCDFGYDDTDELLIELRKAMEG